MDDFLKGGTGAVFLFLYLLPGFLGAVVYDYLAERRNSTNFDKIICALILTLLSSVIVNLLFDIPLLPKIVLSNDTAINDVIDAFISKNILYTSICSVIISILFSYINNHGIIYNILNQIGITYKNNYQDVWQDTFYNHEEYWVRIIFSDSTSLVGWPKFYSTPGKPKELFLSDAEWRKPDNNDEFVQEEVVGPGVYINDFSNVVAIELLKGEKNG